MNPAASWADIDPYIEAFERVRASDPAADPAAFLPPPGAPHATVVLVELLRADLEFGWGEGRPPALDDYLSRFPALRGDPGAVGQLAFEEYRLRRAAGEDPDPADYRSRYGIDTGDWPLPGTDAPHPPLPEYIPAEFHAFRIVREIGRGSIGRVYLATQGELADRPVVLKVATDLRGEPEVLAGFQHTNIVPIYSVHRVGPVHAFCMPFFGTTTAAVVLDALRTRGGVPASGGWLGELLDSRRDGPSPPRALLDRLGRMGYVEAVLWLGARLADGLAYAHERGVLHQDLKPANVLLADDGQPMLLDFNLARAAGAAGGTLAYMSPDRLDAFRAGRAFSDPRDDVYALGLILYELLGGRPVAAGVGGTADEVASRLAADRRRPPDDLRACNPRVTPAVASVVAKCLAADPADRYASAADLRTDLERQLANERLAFAPDPSAGERFRKWRRRHPRLTSATGVGFAAVLVLAVLGGLYGLRTRQLARAEATNAAHDFRADLDAAELLLSSPDPNRHDLEEGLNLAGRARRRFPSIDRSDDPVGVIDALELPEPERTRLRSGFAEVCFLTARGEGLLAARTPDPDARAGRVGVALRWNDVAARLAEGEVARAVRFQRAGLLTLDGRAGEARELTNGADAEGPPESPRGLRAYADRHMQRGEFRAAAGLLRRSNRTDQTNPLGWFLLGTCHEHLRQFRQAVGCYDVAVALRPESHIAYYRRAVALARADQHREAIIDYDETIRLHPDYHPAYTDRAHSRAALCDFAGAVADLDSALQCDEVPTRVYLLRSEWRARVGDEAGAAADRREGLTRPPVDDLDWVARGTARVAGDPGGALADFDDALAINPKCVPAIEEKAAVLAGVLGRKEEAVRVLDAAVAAHPDDALVRSGRAVLLARVGRRAAAHADAKAAEELSADDVVLYRIACVYALTSRSQAADRDEAFRYLRRALAAGLGYDRLPTDPDLDRLRGEEEFDRILAGVGKNG